MICGRGLNKFVITTNQSNHSINGWNLTSARLREKTDNSKVRISIHEVLTTMALCYCLLVEHIGDSFTPKVFKSQVMLGSWVIYHANSGEVHYSIISSCHVFKVKGQIYSFVLNLHYIQFSGTKFEWKISQI